MTDSRYQPNPLRPYYVPPTIGRETTVIPNATTTPPGAGTSPTFSFPDLDYSEYIPEASPSVTRQAKRLLDKAVWKYTSVLMAQPFEVAKLILQARVAQETDADDAFHDRRDPSTHPQDYLDDEEEDDEPNYFSSSAPFEETDDYPPTRGRRGRPQKVEHQRPQQSPERLLLKNPHSLLDALSALSSNSGALAIWRGTNSTFLYSVLLRTFETFFRSFLAAAFGVADIESVLNTSTTISDNNILSSTSPLVTIMIATTATAISALLLAPIDAARTRLILTPSSQEPRSLIATIRTLRPSWLCPTHLIPITFLTSTVPAFIAASTPLVLKTYIGIDPVMNPTPWSICTFFGSAIDLSIKFPLETVLRRAQIATWTSPALAPPTSQSKRKAIKTIVPVPQTYRGILPTMWGIMRDEGYSESQADRTAALMGKAPRRKRKGQGIEGLYRGWRVGLWGLVGIWGTSFVGGLQSGTEAASAGTGLHGGKF